MNASTGSCLTLGSRANTSLAPRPRKVGNQPPQREFTPIADSNRSLRKRNRSLDDSRSRFRISKNRGAETRSDVRRLRCETPEFPRQRPASWPLTSGDVATSLTTRNPQRETTVAGGLRGFEPRYVEFEPGAPRLRSGPETGQGFFSEGSRLGRQGRGPDCASAVTVASCGPMCLADECKWRQKANVPFDFAFTHSDLDKRANATRCEVVDPGARLGYGEENGVPDLVLSVGLASGSGRRGGR
jgi:hypothetical protein